MTRFAFPGNSRQSGAGLPTEPGRVVLKEAILRPPYDGANDYFYISDVDDRDYLTALIKATIPALPKPKVKKNPIK